MYDVSFRKPPSQATLRPLWTGNFKTWYGGTEVLFYYPGDQNWWLGSVINGALTWNFAGNTTGFGQVWDGRPFYVGDFTGGGQADVLFHHPGDSTWWLGTISGTQLTWSLAGNTAGFGNLQAGHVFYTGDFNADGRADVLFYYPADGNWWLASLVGGSLQWSLVGNTGTPLPHTSRVRVHIKTVAPATTAFLNNQIAGMREVFDTAGVFVDVAPIEDLSGDPALNHLWDIDVGGCPNWWPASHTSPDQNELYAHRNGVGENEIAIYIVRSVVASGDSATVGTIGCASHPAAWPSCVLERGGFSRWVMAHEVGHVLGLGHRSDTTDNLMFPSDDFTNTPPDLAADEATKMDQSHFTFTC